MAYGKIKADKLVYDNSGSDVEVTISSLGNKADLASPTFTGTVTIPTPAANDNTTKAASTAYVQTELGDYATTASPTFTGTPAAPTAAANTNTTQIATTAYVQTELGDYATLAAPALTGTATGVNLTLSGNLTVNGTTTTINSTTLAVDDKNIELGTVSSPSDTTADGGGITLKGATDKTITWTNSTDTWDFNQNIKITTGSLNIVGIEGGPSTINLDADEGDDNADIWRIQANTAGNFTISTYSTGSYVVGLQVNSNGNIVGAAAISDSKGDLRSIPQLSKSSAHTIVAADAGQHSINSSGGWVINTSTGFTAGQAITLINNSSGDQTITSTGVTLYNSADGGTPTTLAARGMATVICTASNTYYISGAGLS